MEREGAIDIVINGSPCRAAWLAPPTAWVPIDGCGNPVRSLRDEALETLIDPAAAESDTHILQNGLHIRQSQSGAAADSRRQVR